MEKKIWEKLKQITDHEYVQRDGDKHGVMPVFLGEYEKWKENLWSPRGAPDIRQSWNPMDRAVLSFDSP